MGITVVGIFLSHMHTDMVTTKQTLFFSHVSDTSKIIELYLFKLLQENDVPPQEQDHLAGDELLIQYLNYGPGGQVHDQGVGGEQDGLGTLVEMLLQYFTKVNVKWNDDCIFMIFDYLQID